MKRNASNKPGKAQRSVGKYKELDHRTGALEETCRGKSEAPQDKHTNLDGTEMEQLRSEMNARFEDMEKRLQCLEKSTSLVCPISSQEASSETDCCGSRLQEATNKSECFTQTELSTMVSAEEFHQKEEECEKLKEQKRLLEKNLNLVLAKAMGSHSSSENLNDPCRVSAVLEMYDRLRTHEWEKVKCAASYYTFSMTYEAGSTIIKAVFSKCEEELSQRLEQIFELLEIPVSKETTNLFGSQQELPPGMARDIKDHLKHLYFNYGEDIYQARSWPVLASCVQRSQPLLKFTAECYKIYCLLLLQNPPIKAVWSINPSTAYTAVEHVDNKVIESWMAVNVLWPVLTCKEQLIRKGVIYD